MIAMTAEERLLPIVCAVTLITLAAVCYRTWRQERHHPKSIKYRNRGWMRE